MNGKYNRSRRNPGQGHREKNSHSKEKIPFKVLDAQKTKNKKNHQQIETDKNSLSLNGQIPNIQSKKWIWKATREESKVTYKGRLFRLMAQFSVKTLKRKCGLDKF